ncbi:hypothetical protein [Rhodopirellula bahusiensis]|uniref:Uncharacterized protein n=1 Tax=Rhodopirellula bahusiensis TaxID=2014065 RepID=A0A2G1W7D4_9BACT|nr:hypothetical protein [Rhodopirellula bahusiensis]PHQ34954.1 hypothetical protein CEE69_13055 [Rhodopirellula bahusiensis]
MSPSDPHRKAEDTADQEQLKLMSAAIYEMRILLSSYSGNDPSIRLAERLAYALHNDALAVLEGDGTFNVANARERIAIAEELAGETLGDGYGVLKR